MIKTKLINKIKPEAWIHETDGQISEGRVWGDWKRLAKQHICMYAKPMDTDDKVVKAQGWAGSG